MKLALLALLIFAGCSAVTPPGTIECKGKGTISLSGGPYAGMIVADCGDGFSYKRTGEETKPTKP